MRKILFIDHAPAIGGAENSLLMLMRHLDGWQPHLATVEGKLAVAARADNIPVHIVPLPRLRKSAQSPRDLWRGARASANIARQIDSHALYTNTVRAQTYGLLAARMARKPLVWHFRDFWLGENRPNSPHLDRTLKRLFLFGSRLVITNSHATADHLPKSAKVHVVHNGIEIGRFDPTIDGKPFRHKFNIAPNAPLVGMMGRLRPWKGQMRFLDVAREVCDMRPETRFVVIGGSPFGIEDDYAKRLARRIDELGLADVVKMTGHQQDTPAALAALDLFVHPGEPEPFGLVNVEAMTMGKPVVALNHGALPEIVQDGQSGLLVAPETMAAAIIRLLDDTELRQQIGRTGRERVVQQFTIERTAAQINHLLSKTLV